MILHNYDFAWSIVNINGEDRAERKELVDCKCTSVEQNEVVLDEEEVTVKNKIQIWGSAIELRDCG